VSILELRQYTLVPGRRDELIDLFEREFVTPQEELGIRIVGTFRDLDNPDRFVWLRAFDDMECRGRALPAFYTGPVWKAHRDRANATMIDSDNVLLLHSVRDFPPMTAGNGSGSTITATIRYRDAPLDAELAGALDAAAGSAALATFRTEDAPNNFPALPVRAGEHVFVSFARGDRAGFDGDVRDAVAGFDGDLKTERLRLSPTRRSLLR
jgi:NIPSNAP protein